MHHIAITDEEDAQLRKRVPAFLDGPGCCRKRVQFALHNWFRHVPELANKPAPAEKPTTSDRGTA